MTLRTLIFWPHLVAGVVAGLVILVMSVTGAVLTYERQLVAWSDSAFRSVPPSPGAPRLPVEAILETLKREHPEIAPTAVTQASAADAPVTLAVPQRTLYVDAYSARLLGEGSQTLRRFMSGTRAWHRWLAVEGEGRPIARAITGWSSLIFLFIIASGFYLWLPRRWKWAQVRAVVLFNAKATGKARDFNWHNVIGVWSAIPLFIVVLAGLPISFPWANALVYRAVGEDPPARGGGREGGGGRAARGGGEGEGNREARGGREGGGNREARGGREGGGNREARGEPAPGGNREARGREGGGAREPRERPPLDGLNALWSRAEQQVEGWRTINMRIPESNQAPVVFAIDKGDGGQPHLRSNLTLERVTGRVVTYEAFEDQSLGRRLRSISRFAHTGEVLGIPGQTIAGLATAGGAVLVWTGIALALRRLRAWMKRRRSDRTESASRQSSAA